MSKLSEYSKFDNLDDYDDDSDNSFTTPSTSINSASSKVQSDRSSNPSSTCNTNKVNVTATADDDKSTMSTCGNSTYGNATPHAVTKVGSEPGRYIFECNGRTIYEWDQSLEEVNLYIKTPPNKKASDLQITITPSRLVVGLKHHDRHFLDETTYSKVDTTESSWYLDSEVLHIVLAKAHRGEMWDCPLTGLSSSSSSMTPADSSRMVDPVTREKIRKDLMLERFQEENPGFDFRGATFNGEVPDARSFMGGIRYN